MMRTKSAIAACLAGSLLVSGALPAGAGGTPTGSAGLAGLERPIVKPASSDLGSGRLILAGGPPPWAPAHGYRRKQKVKHYERRVPVYVEAPDVGIGLGRCNRELLGGILGGVAGGVIGSQIGEGTGKTVATIGGTIIGVLIGGSIGRSMDRVDQACVGQVLEQAQTYKAVTWSSPGGTLYRVMPLRNFEDGAGRTCREYVTRAVIEGRERQVRSTACRTPDGSWQQVS